MNLHSLVAGWMWGILTALALSYACTDITEYECQMEFLFPDTTVIVVLDTVSAHEECFETE